MNVCCGFVLPYRMTGVGRLSVMAEVRPRPHAQDRERPLPKPAIYERSRLRGRTQDVSDATSAPNQLPQTRLDPLMALGLRP
jgi:hypothetical protein